MTFDWTYVHENAVKGTASTAVDIYTTLHVCPTGGMHVHAPTTATIHGASHPNHANTQAIVTKPNPSMV